MSDTNYCRSKFKIICNSIAICVYSNKIYISAYTMVICHFSISTVKDNENRLLVFKNSARRVFLAIGSNRREEESWTTLMYTIQRSCCQLIKENMTAGSHIV
jgi:hypothetical protein